MLALREIFKHVGPYRNAGIEMHDPTKVESTPHKIMQLVNSIAYSETDGHLRSDCQSVIRASGSVGAARKSYSVTPVTRG